MIKISYLMRRQPHLSLAEFQSYWSEKHPQAAPQDAFETLGGGPLHASLAARHRHTRPCHRAAHGG